MKWGRKKLSSKSSPSTSGPSFVSHVFPISWLSKFKQKSRDVEAKAVQVKRDGKRNTACMISSPTRTNARRGRFYGGEDDAFWRLSFGEEGVEGKSSRDVMSWVWYDSREEFDIPPSTCQNCACGSRATTVMGKEEIEKFNNLILDARKMREQKRELEILPEMDTARSGQEALTSLATEKERKLKKINPRLSKLKCSELKRNSNEADENPRNSVGKGNLEFEPLRASQRMQRVNYKLTSTDLKKHPYVSPTKSKVSNFKTEEEGIIAAQSSNGCYGISSAEKMSSDWEELKQMKIRELKSKSENQRKSLYISRELQGRRTKQNNKVRVSSPRIKALEDMKKAKLKMKKVRERTMEGRIGLESFAVAKCSFDPQKDFTDSMHEMIKEKKINQPEELEELLACYLTLNPDEYHDLIIKVFRQVWFDLKQTCFDNEFQEEKFHD